MRNPLHLSTRVRLANALILALSLAPAALGETAERVSRTITSVLQEPLPPEDLHCSVQDGEIIIEGPTFRYTVDEAGGVVRGLEVKREGRVVVSLQKPADIVLDDYHLNSASNSGKTVVVSQSKQKVVLNTEGVLSDPKGQRADIPYTLVSTFFNDGVVVTETTLRPRKDLPVKRFLSHQLAAHGRFSHYFHKRRDNNGMGSEASALPPAEKSLELTTLTSCLEVFSQEAALAIFTDRGATHLAEKGLCTATIKVHENTSGQASVSLTQNIIKIGPSGTPFLIKAGERFTFRTGICLAPNRLPHPRRRDLRMYIWIGDQKNPYPTNQEILDAAHLGFTLFQMHRVGTPGEPRPPAGEFDRVVAKVHEAGMLFIWTASADLMYAKSEGVTDIRSNGKWSLWQGFNYGGHYKAGMDPYCDLLATCLASPNGLADYRVATITEMLKRYDVDGMYIDDNLAYANCHLWKEHGHPEPVYDCLIELHEMNWRRRQVLREKCPHMVLIDHCTRALVLPVIDTYDVHLFGEGYNISLDYYRDYFMSVKNLHGQGCLWAGDTEGSRTGVRAAYNMDLLTGGGQYSYTDWRLYPKKFPYAAGVRDFEPLFVKAYNLAQFYFGMYESQPYYFNTSRQTFVTTTPNTYSTIYRNQTWGDYLIPIVNMNDTEKETSLEFHQPDKLNIEPQADYVLFDVNERTADRVPGETFKQGLRDIRVPGQGLRLFYVRPLSKDAPYHLFGGKRISETWSEKGSKLVVTLHAPPGLKDTVLIGGEGRGIESVTVDEKPAKFFLDSSRGIAHGEVTFAARPIAVEVRFSQDARSELATKAISPDDLTMQYLRKPQP